MKDYFTNWSAVVFDKMQTRATSLSELAKKGKLVLFMGDQISESWTALIDQIGSNESINVNHPHWKALDPKFQIELIQKKKKSKFSHRLAEHIRTHSPQFTLQHCLLANLPCKEAITINYDQSFEAAANCISNESISVLPYLPNPKSSRWLLKMHGCISKPKSIIITRKDYIRYMEQNAALAGIAQALLLTSKMLFVGFSLRDENFHKIIDSVRKAMCSTSKTSFATTIQLFPNPLNEELWTPEMEFLPMSAPVVGQITEDMKKEATRNQEIFLDLLGLETSKTVGASCILDERFATILEDQEKRVKQAVLNFIQKLPVNLFSAPCFNMAKQMLFSLGLTQESLELLRPDIKEYNKQNDPLQPVVAPEPPAQDPTLPVAAVAPQPAQDPTLAVAAVAPQPAQDPTPVVAPEPAQDPTPAVAPQPAQDPTPAVAAVASDPIHVTPAVPSQDPAPAVAAALASQTSVPSQQLPNPANWLLSSQYLSLEDLSENDETSTFEINETDKIEQIPVSHSQADDKISSSEQKTKVEIQPVVIVLDTDTQETKPEHIPTIIEPLKEDCSQEQNEVLDSSEERLVKELPKEAPVCVSEPKDLIVEPENKAKEPSAPENKAEELSAPVSESTVQNSTSASVSEVQQASPEENKVDTIKELPKEEPICVPEPRDLIVEPENKAEKLSAPVLIEDSSTTSETSQPAS